MEPLTPEIPAGLLFNMDGGAYAYNTKWFEKWWGVLIIIVILVLILATINHFTLRKFYCDDEDKKIKDLKSKCASTHVAAKK
jgi:hypothetical protein